MDAQIADTSMGLMKALHFLSTQQQRRKVKPKFTYQPAGNMVMGKHKITRTQRAEMVGILQELNALDPSEKDHSDRIKELFKQLGKLPVSFVPVRRQTRIDRSKSYPYRSKKRGG